MSNECSLFGPRSENPQGPELCFQDKQSASHTYGLLFKECLVDFVLNKTSFQSIAAHKPVMVVSSGPGIGGLTRRIVKRFVTPSVLVQLLITCMY